MRFKFSRRLGALACLPFLTGCLTPDYGTNLYSTAELGSSQTTARCRVVSVEFGVAIDEEDKELGKAIGGAGGGIIGSEIGDNIGGGSGAEISGLLGGIGGGIGGAIVGEQLGAALGKKQVVIYGILLNTGEEKTVPQEVAPGDPILKQRDECRYTYGGGAKDRVRPVLADSGGQWRAADEPTIVK